MSHKKDDSPSISFFSFQDIITSVTGIMFLVVLILILMLLIRSNVTPEEQEEMVQTEKLKAELVELQQQMEEAQDSSEKLQQQLKKLEELDLNEIPRRLEAAGTALMALENQNQKMQEDIQKAKVLMESLKTRQQDLEGALRMGGDQKKALGEKEQLVTAKITELEKQLENVRKTMRFTRPHATKKKPLLVECDGATIRVGDSVQNEKPLAVFKGADGGQASEDFLKWLDAFNASDYYVLLLAKPNSFDYVEGLSLLLGEGGYERGREVLPKDDVRVFSE